MLSSQSPNVFTLNCLGMRCPLPLLQTQLRVDAMLNGEVLWVIGSDVQAGSDIAAWCAKKTHDCQSHVPEAAKREWSASGQDAQVLLQAAFIFKITKC